MALNIEDYALISDCHTAALVGRDGSIDWLCLPRYDSASMFGALLGDPNHGRWQLAPTSALTTDAAAPPAGTTATRAYRGTTFILTTVWTTPAGRVEVTDFMPHGNGRADVVRRVRGISGTVEMTQDLRIRFGYATSVPWVRQLDHSEGASPGPHGHGLIAVAGPDAIVVRGPKMHADDHRHRSTFTVTANETVDIQLAWYPSHQPIPFPIDVDAALRTTAAWWEGWARTCSHDGPLRDQVVRSMLVLRALTHEETGGIVAAATTSLPEQAGGVRNWDYRYVWLRDASLTLEVLLSHGYAEEAEEWRAWLLRAIAGDPNDVQIMYGLSGERYLPERSLTSLPGHRGAAPVRVGNGAVDQFQSDVIGEVMVALHSARAAGVTETKFSWPLQRALMKFLEDNWRRPDQGIWEVRGPARHFTHSRVMVWAAFDRAVRGITECGLPGPLERWTALRDEVRRDIDENGFNTELNSFTQYYGSTEDSGSTEDPGSTEADAALLVLAQVGFCAPTDPRMLGTVARLERTLLRHGLLLRYRTDSETQPDATVDGLPPGEHPFLACSFWLVEQYARSGRADDANALMSRLLGFVNDVGLISEEYDVPGGHQMGNTPQALSHLALVRAADAIAAGAAPQMTTSTDQHLLL
ncbi:glycoside hydrolase family 15 protein [Cryobacterium melibiosiphilum]|uniref:Glycoside hydrolase family 15 protein n=1 Tax=Cryobacterium melibiosiphilum TaxID=995039 RepID=A0A3A5MDX9_9MICO|nr:glycoside hydrolase family 15 protein [Cryobacterium melibiosiphilum]RJT84797.1 glycoside hydrolase family 15 protein [Cryobacterium melibiosiphilum]